MVRTFRKCKRFFIYKSLPFLLCLLTVFSLSLCGVFSVSPARAVVGEALVPALFEGLQAAFGIGYSAPGNTDGGQSLANHVWNDFVSWGNSLPSFTAYLTNLGLTVGQWFSNNTEIVETLRYGASVPVLKYSSDVIDWVSQYNADFINQYNITADMTDPVVISSTSGYFLIDGTPIEFFVDSNNLGTHFYMNNSYQLLNGSILNFVKTPSGSGFLKSVYKDGTLVVSSDSSYDSLFCVLRSVSPTSSNFRFYHLDGNGRPYYEFNKSLGGGVSTILGDPTTLTNYAQGYDLKLLPDIPDENEDESGYVLVPPGILGGLSDGWTDSDVGSAINEGIASGVSSNVGSQAWEYTVSDTVPAYATPETPSIVELPLLGIALPSGFTLSLSSIWYYVRQWIASISSWFTWMFGVFSSLPFAMVVPIYASAVVMIVLGIYKRFFM